MINLNHFVKILANIDRNILIYGGEYDKYSKKIKIFFDKLQEFGAQLVFFCRPFFNDINRKLISQVYDHALRGRENLAQFKKKQVDTGNLFPWHMDKRFLYNLMQICSTYGEIHTHLNGTTFHMVQYARAHSDEVLAMVQYDTDFLLYDGEYQYWNLADLDILHYTVKKYCSDTLYNRLQLNSTRQFQIISALSRLDRGVVRNFVQNIQTDEENGALIFQLAEYVRSLENLDSLEHIAADIFGDQYTAEQLKCIQDGMARFEMPEPDHLEGYSQNFRDLVAFFLENNLYYAYGLAVEKLSTNQALVYIDLQKDGSLTFINLITELLMKQIGIVFKDLNERPVSRAIKIDRTIDAQNSDEIIKNIIYPPCKFKFSS